jgi:hypothetical protein
MRRYSPLHFRFGPQIEKRSTPSDLDTYAGTLVQRSCFRAAKTIFCTLQAVLVRTTYNIACRTD